MTDQQPSLDDCLHQVCKNCNEIFGMHRVTKSGRSYCLVPTHDFEREVKWRGGTCTTALLTNVPVRNLKRSPFNDKLGKVVNSLMGYIEVPA